MDSHSFQFTFKTMQLARQAACAVHPPLMHRRGSKQTKTMCTKTMAMPNKDKDTQDIVLDMLRGWVARATEFKSREDHMK